MFRLACHGKVTLNAETSSVLFDHGEQHHRCRATGSIEQQAEPCSVLASRVNRAASEVEHHPLPLDSSDGRRVEAVMDVCALGESDICTREVRCRARGGD